MWIFVTALACGQAKPMRMVQRIAVLSDEKYADESVSTSAPERVGLVLRRDDFRDRQTEPGHDRVAGFLWSVCLSYSVTQLAARFPVLLVPAGRPLLVREPDSGHSGCRRAVPAAATAEPTIRGGDAAWLRRSVCSLGARGRRGPPELVMRGGLPHCCAVAARWRDQLGGD
jgi:hypothetical protein